VPVVVRLRFASGRVSGSVVQHCTRAVA